MARIRHTENGVTREFPVGDLPLTVGRAGRHTIPTMDARASRDHFKVEKTGAAFVASDIGSRNGTLLNGQLLDAPRALQPGDKLQIGDAIFEFLDGTLTTPAPYVPPAPIPPPAPPPPAPVAEPPQPARETRPSPAPAQDFHSFPRLLIRVPDLTEIVLPLGLQPVTVGRATECTLALNHEKISGRHVEISVVPEGALVRDLKSTNGIRFAGELFTERVLRHGEEFTAGPIIFHLFDPRAVPAARPVAAAAAPVPPGKSRRPLPILAMAAAVVGLLGGALVFAPSILRRFAPVTPAVPVDPLNLVRTNPSFEDPSFAGWTAIGVEGQAQRSLDTAIHHDGGVSLAVRGVDMRDRTLLSFVSEQVPLQAGTAYKLEGWIKASGMEGNAGFRLEWLQGGAVIAVTPTDLPSGTWEWRPLSVVGRPPPGADAVRASCIIAGLAGLAWFDGVRLTVSSETAEAASWGTLGGTMSVDHGGFLRLDLASGPFLWNGSLSFVRDADPEHPLPHWIGALDGDPNSVGSGVRIARHFARLGSLTMLALHAEDEDAVSWKVDVETEGTIRFDCELSEAAAKSITVRRGELVEPKDGEFSAENVNEVLFGTSPSVVLDAPATASLSGRRFTLVFRKSPDVGLHFQRSPTWIERDLRALVASATAADKAETYGKALMLWESIAQRAPDREEGREATKKAEALRQSARALLKSARIEVDGAKKFPAKANTAKALASLEPIEKGYEGTEYAEQASRMRLELVPDAPPDVVKPPDIPDTPVKPPEKEAIENARKLLGWAEEALAKEEWLKAEVYARNVIDRWPGTPEEMKGGELLGKSRAGAKAADERDAWIRDRLSRARNYVKNRQAEKAVPLFEEVLAKYPGHALVKGVKEELDKARK